MSKYRIKINGKVYEMEIELISSTSQESVSSKSKTLQNDEKLNDNYVDNKAGAINIVKSPMPGCVVDILVQQGDTVKANDVIIIIESMKMENEVCAPKSGKVKSIFVSKSQNISFGDILFELEE